MQIFSMRVLYERFKDEQKAGKKEILFGNVDEFAAAAPLTTEPRPPFGCQRRRAITVSPKINSMSIDGCTVALSER